MIQLSNALHLEPISLRTHKKLYDLMAVVYPQSYEYLWRDNGSWYINYVYSYENLKAELSEPHSPYYFVNYEGEAIGIIRIQYQYGASYFEDKKATKLHRLYLNDKAQGYGIGGHLIKWAAQTAKECNTSILWLEAMDTHPPAVGFYTKRGFKIKQTVYLDFELLQPDTKGMYLMVRTI